MPGYLKGLTIAASGSFGHGKTYENMKRWVDLNGGTWATTIHEDVTHLIASADHWKSGSPSVQDARRNPSIKIVTFDWLGDTLEKKSKRKEGPYLWQNLETKKQREKTAKKQKDRKAAKREVRRFEAGCEQARRDLQSGTSMSNSKASSAKSKTTATSSKAAAASSPKGKGKTRARAKAKVKAKPVATASASGSDVDSPDELSTLVPAQAKKGDDADDDATEPPKTAAEQLALMRARHAARAKALEQKTIAANLPGTTDVYHVYQDSTGFDYNITLTRVNVAANVNERIVLALYETDFRPAFYATHVGYYGAENRYTGTTLANAGSPYDEAWKAFRKAFRKHAMISWEQRETPEAVLAQHFRGMEEWRRKQLAFEKVGEVREGSRSPSPFSKKSPGMKEKEVGLADDAHGDDGENEESNDDDGDTTAPITPRQPTLPTSENNNLSKTKPINANANGHSYSYSSYSSFSSPAIFQNNKRKRQDSATDSTSTPATPKKKKKSGRKSKDNKPSRPTVDDLLTAEEHRSCNINARRYRYQLPRRDKPRGDMPAWEFFPPEVVASRAVGGDELSDEDEWVKMYRGRFPGL